MTLDTARENLKSALETSDFDDIYSKADSWYKEIEILTKSDSFTEAYKDGRLIGRVIKDGGATKPVGNLNTVGATSRIDKPFAASEADQFPAFYGKKSAESENIKKSLNADYTPEQKKRLSV